MTLAGKQVEWVARYAVIPDPQERLAAIVNRRSRLAPLAPDERVDAHLVPGCVSRVWLAGDVSDGRLTLRADAEAALVGGLARFLAEFYDGSSAEEAATFSTTLFADLGVARLLTPTRAHGLGRVVDRIQHIAHAALRRP